MILFDLSILQTDYYLTHVPLVPRIYASMNWVSIGTGKGLSSIQRQDIIWNIADLLSIAPLGTNFSGILIGIQSFSFNYMRLKISQRNFQWGDLSIYLPTRLI